MSDRDRVDAALQFDPFYGGTPVSYTDDDGLWIFNGIPNNELIQDDLRAILRALNLGDHGRPYSAHDVVHREILPAIASIAARTLRESAAEIVIPGASSRAAAWLRARADALAPQQETDQ